MVIDFLSKVYGNTIVFANLYRQRCIPYLSEEKVHVLRDTRLKKIVRYAAETVPFYRDLFQREKIDPRGIRTVEDLDYLPLIDKDMVRKNPYLFVSTSMYGRKSIRLVTSGSTGRPLTIFHDRYSLIANIAFGERERDVISRFCGRGFDYRELYINYPICTLHKVWDFYRQRTFIPFRPERLTLSVLEPVERIVEEINRFCPNVIISYGSYIETLFRVLALRGIRMYLPKILIYGGDSMTGEGRSFIEEKFGVPVLSSYDAVEALKIGFFCEERRGFHLHEDLCHVKIVDETGKKVANGERGEVVISNLVNRGTVLLNYRLGDIASISIERCPCGRTLTLLSDLDGRMEDIIFLPNGEFVHPRAVWGVFKDRNEVLQYQLVQLEPERFELRLVTVDSETYQRVVGRIIVDLHNLFGESVIIEPGFYKVLERQDGGKFRPVMSFYKHGVSA